MRQISPVNHYIFFCEKEKHLIIFIPFMSQYYDKTGEEFKPYLQSVLLSSGHFNTVKYPESEYTFSIYFNNKITNDKEVIFI